MELELLSFLRQTLKSFKTMVALFKVLKEIYQEILEQNQKFKNSFSLIAIQGWAVT